MTAIDDALKELDERMIRILSRQAAEAHIAGDVRAHRLARLKLSMDLVQSAALEYAKDYRRQLVDRGGTEIVSVLDGRTVREFMPWFADSSKEQRETVAEIIRRGIAEGTPTGVKEYKDGTYPPGSIADQLKEYFDARKSHASTVARTETARIQSDAAKSRYIRAGVRVEYRTARDGKERPEHRALEGIYDADKAPDIGEPNCRCTLIPVVEDT